MGFGGLGQAAARLLAPKAEMTWVAAADQKGYAYAETGLDVEKAIAAYRGRNSIGYLESCGTLSNDSIRDLLSNATVDGYFLALPNLPNTFMADVVREFIASGWLERCFS